jgi:hypothetical protein
MHHIEPGGIKLYFEECGRICPSIFIHEFEADVQGCEPQILCSSRPYRCTKADLASDTKKPAAFGTQLRGLWSALPRGSGPHADPQNELSSAPEKRTATQWCFAGGRA